MARTGVTRRNSKPLSPNNGNQRKLPTPTAENTPEFNNAIADRMTSIGKHVARTPATTTIVPPVPDDGVPPEVGMMIAFFRANPGAYPRDFSLAMGKPLHWGRSFIHRYSKHIYCPSKRSGFFATREEYEQWYNARIQAMSQTFAKAKVDDAGVDTDEGEA